ncbi:hypothetical protein PMIN06_008133 [Paraphaeosphaeria minitans]
MHHDYYDLNEQTHPHLPTNLWLYFPKQTAHYSHRQRVKRYLDMPWKQLEPTGPHVTYGAITFFLLSYALFSLFIRNRLHLSEPPLATLFGIAVGPKGLAFLQPYDWGFSDDIVQEFTRLIAGIQCFAVGLELPQYYFTKGGKWKDIAILLGPVMTFGWLVCAGFIMLLFNTNIPSALIISACLTPTDPVLAASVLSNSQFSTRVPKRVRDLLSAESGVNDGVSFPFLYLGLRIITRSTFLGMFKKWMLITVLYQCAFGIILGLAIGFTFNKIFSFSHKRKLMGSASYLSFYLLLAVFALGIASTLGVDDFLVTFFAGLGFSHGGNFPTADTRLPIIIDLMLNSTMFVFFGAMIPWASFHQIDSITPGRLFALLALVLLFRRIPVVYAMYKMKLLRHIRTTTEALFAGHFGPMGVGALFLAIEARAQLETDTSLPLPDPPSDLPLEEQRTVTLVWPIICFVVLGSVLVHGMSTLVISLSGHFARTEGERASLLGGETEGLHGMVFGEEDATRAEDVEDVDEEDTRRNALFRGA